MSGYLGSQGVRPSPSPALDRAQSKLDESKRTYSRTQQELQQAMRVRATTPLSAVDSSAKDQEISDLRMRLREQEAEMAGLRETIEKQKKTIKTQSEAISNPKTHYATPTPHRNLGQHYGAQSHLALPPPPPPIFEETTHSSGVPPTQPRSFRPAPLPPQQGRSTPFNGPNTQLSVARQPQGLVAPTPSRTGRHVNDFGSPEDLAQSMANMALTTTSTPRGSNRGSSQTPTSAGARQNNSNTASNAPPLPPPPAPYFNPNNGMALIATSGPGGMEPSPMARMFAEVLQMSEMFAYSHVNTPSTQKDNAMPQEVKQRLMNAATEKSAFQFMQTPFTRFMLVNKVILQYILAVILKHDTFAGFDADADQVIDNCKNQMYQTTPAQVKYQLLTRIAEQMKRIKSNPHFNGYVQRISQTRGNELWRTLKPMMHAKTSRDWDDLFALMVKAHELAQAMFSGSEEYKFDFPTVGAAFRKEAMEPRDPFKNIHTPDQLEGMGATVRLGITPLILSRTSTPSGYVNSKTFLKAFVLLKTDK